MASGPRLIGKIVERAVEVETVTGHDPLPVAVALRELGLGLREAWSSAQMETSNRSRHRCDSSTDAITSETADNSDPRTRASDDHRGTA